ncbi:MAG: hypothetical protein ACTSVI_16000 [Promethearchaeota archaeon]
MGDSIGLVEPEPDKIIEHLSHFIRSITDELNERHSGLNVVPCVQYGNESDLYFDDPELVTIMRSQLDDLKGPVYPFIHETTDKQPLKRGFQDKMEQLFELYKSFGMKNITVHFPLNKSDTSKELIEELTSEGFLNLLNTNKVSIDLENNWHGSYFGFVENTIDFFQRLKNKLSDLGRKELFKFFGMTFDTGHFFAQYRIAGRDLEAALTTYFSELKDKIRTLHIHGNDGTDDQHLCFRKWTGKRDGVNTDIFKENQEIFLGALKNLDLKRRARNEDWDIVVISEIGRPFTREQFLEHSDLIFDNI